MSTVSQGTVCTTLYVQAGSTTLPACWNSRVRCHFDPTERATVDGVSIGTHLHKKRKGECAMSRTAGSTDRSRCRISACVLLTFLVVPLLTRGQGRSQLNESAEDASM